MNWASFTWGVLAGGILGIGAGLLIPVVFAAIGGDWDE